MCRITLSHVNFYFVLQAKPREWKGLHFIRAREGWVDNEFVEYIVQLEHVEPWQGLTTVLNSKAVLVSFCLELSKTLGISDVQPPQTVSPSDEDHASVAKESDLRVKAHSLAQMFLKKATKNKDN